jgi:hypothetical protein
MIGAIAVNLEPECKSLRHGCAYRPPDSSNNLRDRRQYPPWMRTRRMLQMIGTIAVNIQFNGLMAIANPEGDAFGPQVMGTAKISDQMQ